MKSQFEILENQQGISVLLSIVILSSLMVITLTLSGIVLRVGQSSRKIGYSEIAYYAAETAVEKALYTIEKERDTMNLEGLNQAEPQVLNTSGGSWTREITAISNCAIECSEITGEEGACVDSSGEINSENPLKVQLDNNSSFQLDLNFNGLTYPSGLTLSWSGSAKVVVLDNIINEQITATESPVVLNDLSGSLYLIRIVNESENLNTFTLALAGENALPIGILLKGTGEYKNEQRILEVERKNWQIY